MPLSPASTIALAAVLAAFACPAVTRADDASLHQPRIRMAIGLEPVLAEGARSPTFQALVARIEQSNLVVYVRCRTFPDSLLDGRLALMGATPDSRYVVIELACIRPPVALSATLGHELRHAVELAAAPTVVDPASFKKLYERIGFRLWGNVDGARYDTNAAIDTGWRVRRELERAPGPLGHLSRHTNEEAK